MMEFVYPHTHLVAGVDEVGRGPLGWRGGDRGGDPRSGEADCGSE